MNKTPDQRAAVEAAYGRCYTCDRSTCKALTTRIARDLAWGKFDAAKHAANFMFGPDAVAVRDEALDSSKAVTAAERECEANAVDWRTRCLEAESALARTALTATKEG